MSPINILRTIQNNKTRALTRHAMRGVDIEKVFTRREFQAQRSDLEKPRAELNKAEQEEQLQLEEIARIKEKRIQEENQARRKLDKIHKKKVYKKNKKIVNIF